MNPIYIWSTPKDARHSVRVICDEEGLSVSDKNIICACIQQESGFKIDAVGPYNKNGTRDFGICQFNDGVNAHGQAYWIGYGATFGSIDEVLENPEKCVRVMIKQFKAGHLNWWASYSSGAYKKWL
jgi:hypothetical protein